MKPIIYFVYVLYSIICYISNGRCSQEVILHRRFELDNRIWIKRLELSSVSKTNCALVSLHMNGSCFGFRSKTNACYIKSNGEEQEFMDGVDVYCTDYSAHVVNVAAYATTTQLTTAEQMPTNKCFHPFRFQTTRKRNICFRIYDSRQQWSEARSTCQNEGGDLLVVADPNMLRFISFSTDDQFYFGMYHIQPSGSFEFVDGRTNLNIQIKPHLWEKDHPNSNADDWCGFVKKSYSKIVWVSSPCGVMKPFICEIPLPSNLTNPVVFNS